MLKPDNLLLRDLIKILILNELLRGGSQRPPHHQMPPRPQFPPFGGNMPSRPQMRLF